MAVRRERVILDLEDNFTSKMARVAAMTALVNKELKDLDGTSVRATKSIGPLGNEVDKVGNSTRRSGPDIDRFSGRLRTLADVGLVAGPALIPLGASAFPLLAAGATALGAASGGIVAAALALHGLGDALGALDAFQADKTPANLAKLDEEFKKLGPDGAEFVRFLDDLEPKLHGLQLLARQGLFPGLEEGIDDLLGRLPQVRDLISSLSAGLGDLATDAGQALAGDRFDTFFDFLQSDAQATLVGFGHSIGNLVEVFANLTAAFAPLTRDFTGGLEQMTAALAKWSRGLQDNDSFQGFLDYVRQSGPQAIDLLGSLATAFASIVKAAAPYGAVVLPALTALADILSTIAASDIGTPLVAGAAALTLFSRAAKPLSSVSDLFLDLRTSPDLAGTALKRFGGAAKLAGGAAGMGLFLTSLQETSQGLSAFEAAAGGALTGFSVGGPWGAAIGGAIGLVLDLGMSHEQASKDVADLTATFDQQTGAITENTRVKIAQMLQNDGLLDSAAQLGIQQGIVTEAIMGNAQAQAQLNTALAGYETDHTVTSAEDLQRSFSDQEIATVLANRAATALRDALPGLTSNFSTASGNARQLAGEVGGTADSMDDGTTAAERFTEALDHLNNKLERRATARDYQAAIDDFTTSVKENGKTLDINTEKGRANQAALDNIAATAAKLVENLHGSDKVAALTQARRDFVDAASKILGSRDAAQQLANQLGILNQTKAEPKVTTDASLAFAAMVAVRRGLAALDGSTATTYVRTIHTTQVRPGTSVVEPHAAVGYAAGGYVLSGAPTKNPMLLLEEAA